MLHQKHLTNLKHSNIFLPASCITLSLIAITILSGIVLSSSTTSADVVDDVTVTVPVSCNMTSELDTAHTATINPGQYQSNIGTTSFTVFCNDNSGYAIYAIGYSNEVYGNNKMSAIINNQLSPTNDIDTGTNTSGANSSWAMKLIPVTSASSGTTQPYTPTIESDTNGSFANYHVIPGVYAKVASFASSTDFTIPSSLQSTYQVYIGSTKPAGTYNGKVKYTLVHPGDNTPPMVLPATLDTGQTVSSKMKSLAATVVNEEETFVPYNSIDEYVKYIDVHLRTSTPAGFIPTENNTISTSTSTKPIYIIFDNTDDAGIMHFYTEGEQIILPPDSSNMFNSFYRLTGISGISDWDASSATDMSYMFYGVGFFAPTFSLDLSDWDASSATNMSYMFCEAGYSSPTTFYLDLSDWDASSATDMSYMFNYAGYGSTSFTLDLSGWDTSSATNMESMFYYAAPDAAAFTLDLSSWNTSNVTNMSAMFDNAGTSADTWSVGDISNWDTSNVIYMDYMFSYAGQSATTLTLDLSNWDTSSVSSMGFMFSGSGYSSTAFTLDLSGWNTSSVTYMSDMFYSAGHDAATWSVTIPPTNGNNISNTASRIYGQDASTYDEPESGRHFTLAQP